MTLQSLYVLMLCISLILLVMQLLVKQKQAVHLLFAVFCGSMAMVAAQELGDGRLGLFAYLVAIGTCATCNYYWLVARALFRGDNGVLPRHLLAAVALGVLMIAVQGLGWADSANLTSRDLLQNGQNALRELITLTSSTMLMLTLWEGSRGLRASKGDARRQQLLFLFSYGGAVLTCMVIARFIAGDSKPWLVAICATQIMVTTQCLIFWRYHHKPSGQKKVRHDSALTDSQPAHRNKLADQRVAERIVQLIDKQQQFL